MEKHCEHKLRFCLTYCVCVHVLVNVCTRFPFFLAIFDNIFKELGGGSRLLHTLSMCHSASFPSCGLLSPQCAQMSSNAVVGPY